MTVVRKALLAVNLAMLSLVSLWAYASHRYDGLNVGGETGDIGFWIRMGDVGCYGGLALFVVCILAALWAAATGRLVSWLERVFWILLPLVGAPALFLVLNTVLNAGVTVAS